jgi:hypothetical protein
MVGGNFKVRCVNNGDFNTLYTFGKVYEISSGVFIFDDGEELDETINCVEDLINNTSAGWELIEEEGEVKMKDLRRLLKIGYIVEHIDGKLSRVEMNENKELIISGEKHYYPLKGNLDKNLEYDEGVGDWAILGIKTIYGYSKHNGYAHKISASGRKVIWKRQEEKSPTQLEIESIELEQRKLADRLSKLKEV